MEKIKRFFTNDWKAKLGSLISAVILWFVILATQSSIVSFPGQVSVNFKNLENGLAVISSDNTVKIKIKAENVNLSTLAEDNFEASIDLSNLSEGTYTKPVAVTSKNSNVQIINIDPSVITFRIEKKVDKKVPVRARLDGSTAEGFGVSDTKIQQSEATVSGAESIIKNITEVVAPIKLNGEVANFSKNTKLFVYSTEGEELKDIKISPNESKVDVTIIRVGDVKTVGIKVNLTGNIEPGYWISSLSTDPTVVSIGGSPSKIALVKFIETEPVNISNLFEDKTVSAKLNLPSGITTEGNVLSVSVKIQVSKSETVKELTLKPNFINIKNNLKVSNVVPEKVVLVVNGSKNILNEATEESVNLNIDLSTFDKGTKLIDLKPGYLKMPAGINFLSFIPVKISVTLSEN